MRLISLIPSITETLIDCNANLVGRSRFCIHPEPEVGRIPAVGGTKRVDWGSMADLQPDLVILDKEENTREMAESCPYPYLALHIIRVEDVGPEFSRLAERIGNIALGKFARRWEQASRLAGKQYAIRSLPGIIEWWRPPTIQTRVEYLIWRDPWMAIGEGTFIHSMLGRMGVGELLTPHAEKYPEIELAALNPQQTVLLFSSEPFPFQRYRDELLELGYACGLIDGESYSWYGTRSLRFLETCCQ
ncbi:helical backbone metal receptor [Sedimenticola selenatireducens]|uniref:helical backbone metal receptor n=1 Tax=Sedimenticola selenatireducens TaxID=191960 RepID=UPI0004BC78FF|nr:helical backbone metal receptor [Sedimenticola selenatireducens]